MASGAGMRAKKSGAKGGARRGATPVEAAAAQPERLDPLLSLAADFYWEQDAEHRFTVWRSLRADVAPPTDSADWLGWTSAELCVAPTGDPEFWARHRAQLAAREPFRDVLHALPGHSDVHYLSLSGAPSYDAQRRFSGYRGVARDAGSLVRLEQLLALEGAAAQALAEADAVAAAVPALLQRTCEFAGFDVGTYFRLDERTRTLRRAARYGDERGVAALLADGAAVPAWLRADPVWNADLGDDGDGGDRRVCGTLLVPVAVGGTLVGVLEFASAAPVAPEAALLRVLRGLAAQLAHLDARTAAFEQLRESEGRFASTLALAAIGISHVDDRGRFIYVNPQLCGVLGYRESELLTKTVKDISHPEDVAVTDELSRQLREGKIASFKAEKRYLRKDGTAVWVGLTVAAKRDRLGRKLYDVSIVEDISARKEAEQCVKYLASHDALTDLPNRATFAQLLTQASELARREQRRIAVLFIDLDRFKHVNDTLGHEAGDALLREAAARLRASVRANDVVARLGGDEFVVLLKDVPHADAVARVAKGIIGTLRAPFSIRGAECAVSASIGVCMHPDGAQEDQAVLRNADMAMYLAKQSGKNGYRFYVDELQAVTAERARIETLLREAWESRDFGLEYSAVLATVDGPVVGFETRLRFKREELDGMPADKLAAAAAEAGLIAPLNDWTLRTACTAAASWQHAGLPLAPLAVPVAAAQLRDPKFVSAVRDELAAAGLDARRLELNVDDAALLASPETSARALGALDAMGCTLAFDGFGGGRASFADLRRYPLRTLKLSGSRVAGIAGDPELQRYVEGVIVLARALGLSVVATGVAAAADAAHLAAAGCLGLQGAFAPHALDADACAALLKARVAE
jgi:diguanylate cyclase (GGDEF)-like protein/PAS domain S-box-containing protein